MSLFPLLVSVMRSQRRDLRAVVVVICCSGWLVAPLAGGSAVSATALERQVRPQRLTVTEGKANLPDPSGLVRIPDRWVIAQARVAFEVRLDNARPGGTGRAARRWA
jgi:hypothetical protein